MTTHQRTKNPYRVHIMKLFPKARIHCLEDGRAQVINPTGNGCFEALGPAVGSRYQPRRAARSAWMAAYEVQKALEVRR